METSYESRAYAGARPKTHYWEPFLEDRDDNNSDGYEDISQGDSHGEGDGETSTTDYCHVKVWRPITDGIAYMEDQAFHGRIETPVSDQEYTLVLGNFRLHAHLACTLEIVNVTNPCESHAIDTILTMGGYRPPLDRPHVRVQALSLLQYTVAEAEELLTQLQTHFT